MEELMQRVLLQKIATPADLQEHHKWTRRVGPFYGILFLGGISFVVVYHPYQPYEPREARRNVGRRDQPSSTLRLAGSIVPAIDRPNLGAKDV